jgi:hypothetical protein
MVGSFKAGFVAIVLRRYGMIVVITAEPRYYDARRDKQPPPPTHTHLGYPVEYGEGAAVHIGVGGVTIPLHGAPHGGPAIHCGAEEHDGVDDTCDHQGHEVPHVALASQHVLRPRHEPTK